MKIVRMPFDMSLPQDLRDLAALFTAAGFQLYVVGGAVRDAVMGVVPKDFDVATDATPDQVIELLRREADWRVLEVGKAFGVVRACRSSFGIIDLRPGEREYEIATFRTDIGEGRRPEAVSFTTIDEDVKRRDLTINALFYDIGRGEVVDMVGGLQDIDAHVIRTVGNPEDRFREDRLRVLRAIRFAARFGWILEAATHQAIFANNDLDGVSAERIRDELIKGLSSSRSVRHFLQLLDEFNMWPHIFPGLTVSPAPDVMVVNSGRKESRCVPVVLAVLLDTNPINFVARRLNELKYTAKEVAQVTFLMRFRDLKLENAWRLKRQQAQCHVVNDMLVDYCGKRGAPNQRLLRAFINYELTVTGDALLEQGLIGAELGRELERLETIQFRSLLDSCPQVTRQSLEEDADWDGNG